MLISGVYQNRNMFSSVEPSIIPSTLTGFPATEKQLDAAVTVYGRDNVFKMDIHLFVGLDFRQMFYSQILL